MSDTSSDYGDNKVTFDFSDFKHGLIVNVKKMASFYHNFLSLFHSKALKPLNLDAGDTVSLIYFSTISVFIHFFKIQYPKQTVFDEVYTIQNVHHYINGTYFTPDHPPLGDIIMAKIAQLFLYKMNFGFPKLENNDYPTMHYVGFRTANAFFSGLVAPLSYFIFRLLDFDKKFSFIGSTLFTCDFVSISRDRYINVDGFASFFFILALLSIVAHSRFDCFLSLVLEGIAIGLTVSSSYSTWPIFGFAFVMLLTQKNRYRIISSFTIVSVISFLVYFGTYYLHVKILPFQSNLPNIPNAIKIALTDKNQPRWEYHYYASKFSYRALVAMFSRTKLDPPNVSQSGILEIPLMIHSAANIYPNNDRTLYFFGNPALLVGVLISIILIIFLYLIGSLSFNSYEIKFAIGYAAFIILLAFGKHYLYEYRYSLFLGIFCLIFIIGRHTQGFFRGFISSMFFFLFIFCFVFYAPLVYGLSVIDYPFFLSFKPWVSK